jgi:hypothetical protein
MARSNESAAFITFVGGLAIGAGLMFLLDSKLGRSRRAYLREKSFSIVHRTRREIDRWVRDKQNRLQGVKARTWGSSGTERALQEVNELAHKAGILSDRPATAYKAR